MPGPSHGSGLLPWEHATPKLRRKAAEEWLREHGHTFKAAHIVERWAVFYESERHEARHQPWKLDRANTLVPDGPHKPRWPIEVEA
jgi:hypothetical protein